MHAPGKGISQSALPYRRTVPTWLKLTSEDVKDQIFKLSKKGLTPSQIGLSFETATLLPKSVLSLETRSYVFSNPRDWPPIFQRTSTI